jgi:TMEM175 potassium channel family protein
VDTQRLETFSDGVFAIAITLLILEVRAPDGHGSLAHGLWQAWPDYIGYVLSFIIIGIMWANHHSIFRLIDRTSHGLIVANLLLLMCVAFIPFPTKVLGEHLQSGASDQRTAALFYSGTFFVTALFYNALWRVASRDNRLIAPGFEAAAAEVSRRFNYGPPSYLFATLVAIGSVPASLAINGALALLYILPQRDPET